ncbi:DUF2845 domain-containing protein [Rhodanobacter sp. BL-MT-08]
MRRLLLIPLMLIPLMAISFGIHANDTLRVGQQVLTSGDPVTHVIDLLGSPVYKEPLQNEYGTYVGERWQYRRDSGRVVTITIVGGRVANIEESQAY